MNKIEIVEATSKDRLIWNDYVSKHINSTYSHYFEWSEIINITYSLDSEYLMFYEDQKIVGIFPLIKMKSFFGNQKLISVPFTNYGGPLFDDKINRKNLLDELVKNKNYLQKKIIYKSLSNTNTENPIGQVTQMLRLYDEETMWKEFKREIRTSIRKAVKANLDVKYNLNDLNFFFSNVYTPSIHRLGTPHHSYKFFSTLFKLLPKNTGLITIWKDNVIIGGIIYFIHNQYFSVLVSNSLSEYNKYRTNNLLIWEAIKIAIQKRKKYFDFGRSTSNTGTYFFKKKWGAADYKIKNRIAIGQKFVEMNNDHYNGILFKVSAKLWKKLPLTIIRYLGPLIRKYLS